MFQHLASLQSIDKSDVRQLLMQSEQIKDESLVVPKAVYELCKCKYSVKWTSISGHPSQGETIEIHESITDTNSTNNHERGGGDMLVREGNEWLGNE